MSNRIVVVRKGRRVGDQPYVCVWNGAPEPLEVERGDKIVFGTDSSVLEEIFAFLEVLSPDLDVDTVFEGKQPQPFPIDTPLVVRPDEAAVPDGTLFRWAVTDDPDPAKRNDTLERFPGGNGQASGPN